MLHLGRWGLESEWMTALPAIQCILLVFRLQFYTQAFRPTRFAFVDTREAHARCTGAWRMDQLFCHLIATPPPPPEH